MFKFTLDLDPDPRLTKIMDLDPDSPKVMRILTPGIYNIKTDNLNFQRIFFSQYICVDDRTLSSLVKCN